MPSLIIVSLLTESYVVSYLPCEFIYSIISSLAFIVDILNFLCSFTYILYFLIVLNICFILMFYTFTLKFIKFSVLEVFNIFKSGFCVFFIWKIFSHFPLGSSYSTISTVLGIQNFFLNLSWTFILVSMSLNQYLMFYICFSFSEIHSLLFH